LFDWQRTSETVLPFEDVTVQQTQHHVTTVLSTSHRVEPVFRAQPFPPVCLFDWQSLL